MTASRALELDDVVVEYERRGLDPVRAVAGASLAVERGQIVGLVGESGCGKSTLARAAVGMVAPTRGTIRFEGQRGAAADRGARARASSRGSRWSSRTRSRRSTRGVGSASRSASALAVLGLASRRAAARAGRGAPRAGRPSGRSPRAAIRTSSRAGSGSASRSPARSPPSPSVIVLDEPLASLDASAQAQIANLLVELARELELGLLLISHDLAIVRHVADAVAVMYLGRIAEIAPTARAVGDAAAPVHARRSSAPSRTPTARARCRRRCPARCPTRRGRRPDAASIRAARTRSSGARRRSRSSSSSPRPGRPPAGCNGRASPRCLPRSRPPGSRPLRAASNVGHSPSRQGGRTCHSASGARSPSPWVSRSQRERRRTRPRPGRPRRGRTRSSSIAPSRSGRPTRNGPSSRRPRSSTAAIYDTLLTFRGGDVSRPVLMAARGYRASGGGRTYTFDLRRDIRFADGTPMTAADVVFSFRRLINLKGNPVVPARGRDAFGARPVHGRAPLEDAEHRDPVDRREHVARDRELEAGEAARRHRRGRTRPRPTRPSGGSTRRPRWAPGAGRTC